MRSIRIFFAVLTVIMLVASAGVDAKGKKRRKGKKRVRPAQEQPVSPDPDQPVSFDVREFLAGDSDEDGVANAEDPCWASPGGAPQLHKGCTALDIIQMPDSLAGALPDAVNKAADYMEMLGGLESMVRNLEQTLDIADEAVLATRSGDACMGQSLYADVEGQLASVSAELGVLIGKAYASIGEPTDFQDDVREIEHDATEMEYLHLMASRAQAAAEDLMTATGAVCDVAIPGIVTRGVVARIDDARRRIHMKDGRTFAMAVGADIGEIAEAQDVLIEGTDLADGTGAAMSLMPKHGVKDIKPGVFFSCARLRIAPIQPFSPVSFGPYTLHHPLGYRYTSPFPGSTSVLRVEAGMRLGIENGCSGSQIQFNADKYSVTMHLTYVAKKKGTTGVWLASSYSPGSEPVSLPDDADPAFPAILTVKHRVAKCTFRPRQGSTCGPLKILGTNKWTLHMVERGSMCTAFYEKKLFEIEDREPGWFKKGKLTNIISFAVGDGGAAPSFFAQGYSTYPTHAYITAATPFTIYSHDIYPVFRGANTNENRLLQAATGVTHAAGLVWPRALGFRNVKNYQYSCSLPRVVRDVVDFCPGKSRDSYYHMPFPSGQQWTQGQGNLSDPGCTGPNCRTHATGHAYDMLNGCGANIVAARAGRVVFVRESQQAQTQKWCCSGQPKCSGCAQSCCSIQGANCPGNEIWIQHQDASYGKYVHMPKNGVIPQVGDVVRRGQPLGTVGITGNTSGPHVHFETRDGGSGTHLALFQAVDHGTATQQQPNLLHCYEPLENQPIHSDNKMCTNCVPQ